MILTYKVKRIVSKNIIFRLLIKYVGNKKSVIIYFSQNLALNPSFTIHLLLDLTP